MICSQKQFETVHKNRNQILEDWRRYLRKAKRLSTFVLAGYFKKTGIPFELKVPDAATERHAQRKLERNLAPKGQKKADLVFENNPPIVLTSRKAERAWERREVRPNTAYHKPYARHVFR